MEQKFWPYGEHKIYYQGIFMPSKERHLVLNWIREISVSKKDSEQKKLELASLIQNIRGLLLFQKQLEDNIINNAKKQREQLENVRQ